MAADLASTLLGEVLGFGRARLRTLLDDVAGDPAALLEALAPGTPVAGLRPETIAVVTEKLDAAKGHLAQLTLDLALPPQRLAEVQAPFLELAGAVANVRDAIDALGVDIRLDSKVGLVEILAKAAQRGGAAFGGLVSQLGLNGAAGSVADGFSADDTTISYLLVNAAPRALPGPAGALTLNASTLTAVLTYADSPTLALVVETGVAVGLAADGFVKTLAGEAASASATVKVSIDTARGVTFGAGAHNRIDLPGRLEIPGVTLRQLGLEAPDEPSSALELTASLSGELGPLQVVVDGAGIRLTFAGSPPTPTLSLRAPSGAGVALDAGLVSGGGFLTQRDGVYGGALDLDLGPIGIKAVGLLRPDPFSLVLVLTVSFRPPIQLSFGFTLNAVGGVLAIQRVVAVDALRAGVRNHTVDTVFFPRDPVAAAPTILAALANIFPERDGGFVVGPLFELGWGSPVSFVTARLGVVLSAATDPTLVLLGSLRMALPAPDAAIVDLRAELYGEITADHTLVLVSLEGSKVAGFPLSGDFGLLIGYGADPEIAISAGGFHPSFSAPGELAGMRRVSIDISPPSLMTLRTEAYFALTSNSFQLGCRAEMRAEVAGVGAEGHLQFDALVRFEPFHFEIDISAGVSLYAFDTSFASVELRLHLEGPGPWVASGSASLSLLAYDVDFDLPRITWGEGPVSKADPVSPVQLVAKALRDPRAWAARLPAGSERFVRLVEVSGETDVVVHPLGAFEVRQRVAPLETKLDRIGRSPVSVPRVNLAAPNIGGLPAKAVSHAEELFALGQFVDMTNDEKLSSPAFERRPAGLVLSGANIAQHGTPVETPYRWETVYPKEPLPKSPEKDKVLFNVRVTAAVLATGAAGTAAVRLGNPYAVEAAPVALADPAERRILDTRTLAAAPGATTTPLTATIAAQTIAELELGDPDRAGTLQLVAAGAI